MPSFSREDAEHVAAIIHARRQRWAVSAIVKALGALGNEGHSLPAVLAAGLRAAADERAETPVMIPRYAPPLPPRPGTEEARCGDHPEQPAQTCRDCRSMELTGERDPAQRGKRTEAGSRVIPGDAADFQARWAQIRATAATLATDTKRHTPNPPAGDES